MNLGALLRQKRKERKLTLKVVAEKAGISEGFLSQIENDVNSPSVDTLVNICSAIGMEAGDLLNQARKQEKLVVVRRDDWDDADIPASGFVTRRFFPPENRRVIDSSVLLIEKDRSIPVRKNIKNSQEVLCVLRGSVDLIHGDERITLSEGDAVHYRSVPEKQLVTGRSKGRAAVLWVGTL
jgi:transcriptional regulator with XRE-family HTH domain